MAHVAQAIMTLEPGGAVRLPLLARALLRLSPRSTRERALADLEVVHARVSSIHGRAAADRACTTESFFVVVWWLVDRLRVSFRGPDRSISGGTASRRLMMGSGFIHDVRFGLRSLLRRPGFTIVAVGVLALGIGANVAIFSLADRLFLQAPPEVEAPERLVRVFRSWAPGMGGSVSYPDYEEYRDGATGLTGLAAYGSSQLAATARIGAGSVGTSVVPVTANYFDVLGIRPASGRFFVAEENVTPDTHPVAVVSWAFWRDHLGGSPDAIGSNVSLNGHAFTIVGVAPRGFRGLTPGEATADVYIPIMMLNAINPRSDTAWRERLPDMRERWLAVVGRLAPGATATSVQSEMTVIASRNRVLNGESAESTETALVTTDYRWIPRTRSNLVGLTRILLFTVGLLLVVAAANVAILMLARASARDREIGIRSAMGASRGRVARQLLAESLLIGVGGCVLGVVLATGAARVAGAMLPVTILAPLYPDAAMVTFAAGLSLLTALLVGMVPAVRAARTDVVGMIHGRDRTAGGSRVRDALVVLQVALSLILVAGAAVFGRSMIAAQRVDIGFDDRGVLMAGVNLANHGYDEARGRVLLEDALRRIRSVPGVTIATLSRQVPFRGDWSTDMTPWSGDVFADGRPEMTVGLNAVGPEYFEAMGVPIVRGRTIMDSDGPGSEFVIVVNEEFARRAFPGGDAVGQRVPFRGIEPSPLVVGVARDATYYVLDEDTWPQVYISAQQTYQPRVNFLVKTSADPLSLVRPVQEAVHAVDPDLAFGRIDILEAVHGEQTARYRASANVVGLSGLIALLLASAGLYGVMAYRVSQRTREIGVRMALGATRAAVAGGVVRRGVILTLAGVVLGTLGALAMGKFIEGLLFGVAPRDPVSLAVAPLVLAVVAIIAGLVPARRAMRVDPMSAMRVD